VPTTPEQVLVTAGALHGVAVTIETLVGRGGRLLVEHPTYPNALDAIRVLGARAVPVALTVEDPAAMVLSMSRAARQVSPRAAYVMPDFQNPTGLLLDEELRRRLAVGLEQAGVLAIVGETLADLGLDTEPPVPFAGVARPASVVTVGSMSKNFWVGLRVGWLRAEADVVRRLAAGAGHTQMSGPVLEQLAACHLLDAEEEVPLSVAPTSAGSATPWSARSRATCRAGRSRSRQGVWSCGAGCRHCRPRRSWQPPRAEGCCWRRVRVSAPVTHSTTGCACPTCSRSTSSSAAST